MNHDNYEDAYLADILNSVKSIAIVGTSANSERPSFGVARYLIGKGYEVYPVNPGHAGGQILDRPVYARLADIPTRIDMVDIFRASKAVASVVEQALALEPLPRAIWMQLSVRDDEAAARAEAAGIDVVMNRCPKIEYERLKDRMIPTLPSNAV